MASHSGVPSPCSLSPQHLGPHSEPRHYGTGSDGCGHFTSWLHTGPWERPPPGQQVGARPPLVPSRPIRHNPGSPADLGDGPCPGPVFANTCRCVCVRPPVWTPTGGPWPHLDRGWSARVRVTSAWLCPMSPIASGLWSSAGVPLSSPMSGCPPWYAHGSVSLSVRTGCPCLHRRLSPCPQGDTRFPDTRLHETSPFLFSCIAVDWV